MIDKLKYSENTQGEIVKTEHAGFVEYHWKDKFGNHGQRRESITVYRTKKEC